MTLDVGDCRGPHEQSTALKGTHTVLLVLTLFLLVAGFPFLLFGSLLVLIEGGEDVISGGRYFAFSGLVAMLCALGIEEYLRRRDGWVLLTYATPTRHHPLPVRRHRQDRRRRHGKVYRVRDTKLDRDVALPARAATAMVMSEPRAKVGHSRAMSLKLKTGNPLDVEEAGASDFISDLIHSDCITAYQAHGWGSPGKFPISYPAL